MALGAYLTAGFIIGLILVLLYALAAIGTPGVRPNLSRAIGLFLAANGITASIRLFVLVATARSLGALSQTDRIYLAVGAIAAMWISLETIGRSFAGLAPEPEDEPKKEE